MRRGRVLARVTVVVFVGVVVAATAQAASGDATSKRKARPCEAPSAPKLPISSTTSTTVRCRAAAIGTDAARGEWKGSLDAIAEENVPGNACYSTWDGTFTLTVRENGTVVGKGQATSAGPHCSVGFQGPAATDALFSVGGSFTGSEFRLRFNLTSVNGFEAGFHLLSYPGPPTLRVPVLPKNHSRAVGAVSLGNTGPEELAGGGGDAGFEGLIVLRKD